MEELIINIKNYDKKTNYIKNIYEIIKKTCTAMQWSVENSKPAPKEFFQLTIFSNISNDPFSNMLDKKAVCYLVNALQTEDSINIMFESIGMLNYGFNSLLNLLIQKLNSDKYECILKQCEVSKYEKLNADCILNNIFKKFHASVQQLKKRYDNRHTLEIKDEYDVQDYLHALLIMYFDDIRKEDTVPKVVGSSSRGDFFLAKEGIMIETKISSQKNKDKQLGEQIILDIKKYTGNDKIKKLYFFVYNPYYDIDNVDGFVSDLEKDKNIDVIVKVFPKQ